MTRTINLTRSIIIMLMTGLLVLSGLVIANASLSAPVPMIPENFSSLAPAGRESGSRSPSTWRRMSSNS